MRRRLVGARIDFDLMPGGEVARAGEQGRGLAAVTGISGMNRQIAAAAHEQGAVTAELDRNILQIKSGAEKSAHSSQETAVAGAQLAELAAGLRTLVSQFKVSEPTGSDRS